MLCNKVIPLERERIGLTNGIHFSEAVTIWLDNSALEIPDPNHSQVEERWIRLGLSRNANVLVVVYVEKIEGERIRLVSARKATRSENKQYISR